MDWLKSTVFNFTSVVNLRWHKRLQNFTWQQTDIITGHTLRTNISTKCLNIPRIATDRKTLCRTSFSIGVSAHIARTIYRHIELVLASIVNDYFLLNKLTIRNPRQPKQVNSKDVINLRTSCAAKVSERVGGTDGRLIKPRKATATISWLSKICLSLGYMQPTIQLRILKHYAIFLSLSRDWQTNKVLSFFNIWLKKENTLNDIMATFQIIIRWQQQNPEVNKQ